MTFAAEEIGQILSRDARGRVLVSRERRESLLEEYDRSGMSGVKFAQYLGIKYSTLAQLAPKPASSSRAGKVVDKSWLGQRGWPEHWGVD
jgi:hypothetical protein